MMGWLEAGGTGGCGVRGVGLGDETGVTNKLRDAPWESFCFSRWDIFHDEKLGCVFKDLFI